MKNIEMNAKIVIKEKDNQQPKVDKPASKWSSTSPPHSSKSNSQDIWLQAKRKQLEALFGEDDFNLSSIETEKTDLKKPFKKRLTPGFYPENQHEEKEKINARENHYMKRKHENKHVQNLEPSEKRCKSTDDKFDANIKSGKSDYNRKNEERVINKQISNHSNDNKAQVNTNTMEETLEVIITIPEEYRKLTNPLLHAQLSSPSHVTESSSQLLEEQNCVIDLDDLPDDDIQENPMTLFMDSEEPLEYKCIGGEYLYEELTQDSGIFEVLGEYNPKIDSTENEEPIQVYETDQDYNEEQINELKTEEIFHSPTEFQEIKYFAPDFEAEDVKPDTKESIIFIVDDDDATEELVKIDYSDFAASFVDDFRYYNFVENSVFQFCIKSKSSAIVENQNMYSELFESRNLIFVRIAKAMYNYLQKHVIVNFDCRKLIDEISKAYSTNWSTTISHKKILRFLHDVSLTWRDPDNDSIKIFCNNISYNMLLFNDENDNGNNRRPNSIISGTSEADVTSNSVPTPHTEVQTASEQNQQVEQNLGANRSRISPRPIEQLLANPSISGHQSPLLASNESQSSNNTENKLKQSPSQNPSTLYPSIQTPHTINQSASNQLLILQSASRTGALLPPSYEASHEIIRTPSQSWPVNRTPLMTLPTSQSLYHENSLASKLQHQLPQNVPQTPQFRLPNANILTNPSPIAHFPNPSQPKHALHVQQFSQDVSAHGMCKYTSYQTQHSHHQPNLDTYYTNYSGFYQGQSGGQLQCRDPQKTVTDTLIENFVNANRHAYNLENETQLQQAAQLHLQAAPEGTRLDSNNHPQIQTAEIPLNLEGLRDRSINVPEGTSVYLQNTGKSDNRRICKYKDEKPYACKICNYRTAYKGTLKSHSKTHNLETFTCEMCDYKSSHKGSLTRHSKSHWKP